MAAVSLSLSCGRPSVDGCPSSCGTAADCASCVPVRTGGYFDCACDPGDPSCATFSCFADCYDGASGGDPRNCATGTVCTEVSCAQLGCSGVPSDDGQGNDWVCYPGSP